MNSLTEGAVARLQQMLATPPLPPRYRPIEVIGRGGMGVVWRVEDRLLHRDVAVKILAEHRDPAAWAARLTREARILAKLEHPGIVAVHDAGVLDDGRPWYAMRLVRGRRLDSAAPEFATVGEAVRVLIQIAGTVGYAHAQGVLHRDLTPGNVMLGPFGEILVLDWGVASLGRSDVHNPHQEEEPAKITTAHGTVIGTPGYMPPEQARGLAADERSDVYGLGAIMRDVLLASGGTIPRPLRAIWEYATAEHPEARYTSVRAMQDDLERFQDGLPVLVYRERVFEKIVRVLYQYRTPILLVLAYLVMRVAVLWWKGI